MYCVAVIRIKNSCFLILVTRLEEKESLVKADYDKLHDRYTEVPKHLLTPSLCITSSWQTFLLVVHGACITFTLPDTAIRFLSYLAVWSYGLRCTCSVNASQLQLFRVITIVFGSCLSCRPVVHGDVLLHLWAPKYSCLCYHWTVSQQPNSNSLHFQLFKSHMEMMERTKAMMSADKSEADSSSAAERFVLICTVMYYLRCNHYHLGSISRRLFVMMCWWTSSNVSKKSLKFQDFGLHA